MSDLKFVNRTSMSGSQIAQNEHNVIYDKDLRKPAVKSPLNNPPKKEIIYNSSISVGGVAGGETHRLDKIAAAKFKKLIGKELYGPFRRYHGQYLIDTIELVSWKIGQSRKGVNKRAAFLFEALRSNWIADDNPGFKTSRQRRIEHQTVIESAREARHRADLQKKQAEADRPLYQQARAIMAKLDQYEKSVLEETIAGMIGQNLPRDPIIRSKVMSTMSVSVILNLMRQEPAIDRLTPDILAKYKPFLNNRFKPADGPRGQPG